MMHYLNLNKFSEHPNWDNKYESLFNEDTLNVDANDDIGEEFLEKFQTTIIENIKNLEVYPRFDSKPTSINPFLFNSIKSNLDTFNF
jgi:hypothetical protein